MSLDCLQFLRRCATRHTPKLSVPNKSTGRLQTSWFVIYFNLHLLRLTSGVFISLSIPLLQSSVIRHWQIYAHQQLMRVIPSLGKFASIQHVISCHPYSMQVEKSIIAAWNILLNCLPCPPSAVVSVKIMWQSMMWVMSMIISCSKQRLFANTNFDRHTFAKCLSSQHACS